MSSKVETNITRRWETGMPHHPKSVELYASLAKLDWEFGNDFFCFKQGGDGDNGEHLMYLLDIHFERLDEGAQAPKTWEMDKSEKVMAVKRGVIDPLCTGKFTRQVEPIRRAILENMEFVPRQLVEQDFSRKQIIPYIVLRFQDRFLLIRRTPKQGEQRLHDRFALGVGGHINARDTAADDLLEAGMRRELNEEISVQERACRLVGVINVDAEEVDRVHLGLVYLLDCASPDFTNLEPAAYTAEWKTAEQMIDVLEHMESWARIVFEQVVSKNTD